MDGAVPLHDAVQYGFDNYVVHLLKHGADPTIQNDMDKSPLDVAPPAIQALILSTCKESNDEINDHPEAMEVENAIVESNEPTEKVIEEDKEVSPVVEKPNEQTENLNKEDTVVPQINDNLDSMEVENAIVESKEHAENAIEEEELVPTVVVNDDKGAQTDAISIAEFGTQFNPIMTDATNNTDLKTVTVATQVGKRRH